MSVSEKTVTEITAMCCATFRSFGGGAIKASSLNNPIALAMANSPAQFAAGVDISEVVRFVLAQSAKQRRSKARKAAT